MKMYLGYTIAFVDNEYQEYQKSCSKYAYGVMIINTDLGTLNETM